MATKAVKYNWSPDYEARELHWHGEDLNLRSAMGDVPLGMSVQAGPAQTIWVNIRYAHVVKEQQMVKLQEESTKYRIAIQVGNVSGRLMNISIRPKQTQDAEELLRSVGFVMACLLLISDQVTAGMHLNWSKVIAGMDSVDWLPLALEQLNEPPVPHTP